MDFIVTSSWVTKRKDGELAALRSRVGVCNHLCNHLCDHALDHPSYLAGDTAFKRLFRKVGWDGRKPSKSFLRILFRLIIVHYPCAFVFA